MPPAPPRKQYSSSGRQPYGRSNQASSASSILFVGSVPFDWDENNMRSVVCGSGKVVDVRLGFDHVGKNKGFCFVEYQTPEDAAYGRSLLSQVKIGNGNKVKNLRIEESKEGLRANNASVKQLMTLTRDFLPPNVQIPDEMYRNVPGNGNGNYNQANQFNQSPMGQSPVGQFQQTNQQIHGYNQPQVQQSISQPGQAQVTSRNLPQPPILPFIAPDKINQNLSQIAPPVLIELLGQLKNTVNTPEEQGATAIFQGNPVLATATAQVLLLMGLIDDEVINESSNATNAAPQIQEQNQYSNQQYQNQQYPNQQYSNQQYQNQQYSNQQYSNQNQNQNQNQYSNQQYPQTQSQWPHLPPQTQQKLSQLPANQADLIAQVLTIPPEQIPSLEPEKQQMVNNLRAQYL
ncbi:hypothetical protein CLIB1444_02S06942 [[Candida] jaroonii]|uniref:Uncharacterized protein n=1 Tax=[Candida] jaroonii TaxID=467808 RepID=A0ACA9Y4Q7_9ASCO|nr:hypothetical protein CLIB1444_02S06942 [[Candida] jaroonii]